MEENEDTRRNEELSKLHFEFFKHLTTLAIAAALAVLAVYRDLIVESFLLGLALSALALCTAVSLFGMLEATTRFERGGAPTHLYKRMEAVAVISLGTGVVAAVDDALADALGIPFEVPLALLWGAIIVARSRQRRRHKRSAKTM